MLWVALHFPHLPPAALESIAAWACQFTPRISLEPPVALLAEVEGSLRYFGGRDALLASMRCGAAQLGFEASLGLAGTPRAALWLAQSGSESLDEVPLHAIGLESEFFRSIGVSSVGELMRLPREGLARRCGQELIDMVDCAMGAAPEARKFFIPPAQFDATLELPAQVRHAEALLFAARRLLARLEGLLAARHAGIRGFALKLDDCLEIEVGLASPTRDGARMERLLREKLDCTALERPVQAIRLLAGGFEPLAGRSAGMFGDAAADDEDWARLLERLRLRLGQDALCGLATYPDHRPEHAWQRVDPGEWDPRDFHQPGPRPLWLLEAKKLAQSDFALLAGPERIECGWWDGDEARRDYFLARLGAASLAWIYREGGEWYLHGLFA